jgi:hypothetical protein
LAGGRSVDLGQLTADLEGVGIAEPMPGDGGLVAAGEGQAGDPPEELAEGARGGGSEARKVDVDGVGQERAGKHQEPAAGLGFGFRRSPGNLAGVGK